MAHDDVTVRTCRFRHEAELARAVLAGHGIEAHIVSDDCGGLQPVLSALNGVCVLVSARDRETADEILGRDGASGTDASAAPGSSSEG